MKHRKSNQLKKSDRSKAKVQDILLQMKNPKRCGVENLQQQVLLNDLELDSRERDKSAEKGLFIRPKLVSRSLSGDDPLSNMIKDARNNQIGKNRVLIVENDSFQALAL